MLVKVSQRLTSEVALICLETHKTSVVIATNCHRSADHGFTLHWTTSP